MTAPDLTIQFDLQARGQRLDKALAAHLPDLSRSQLQRLIGDGWVLLDGAPVTKTGHRLQGGEVATVHLAPAPPSSAQPEAIPLKILYQDADLLVVDKPAGMVVHPAAGHHAGTLVNAVLGYDQGVAGAGETARPGIVHRLDKDTSGLILVARHDAAHRALQAQFRTRAVEKHYLALVDGHPPTPTGRIEAPIGRDPRQRQRMAVVPASRGREAVTEYATRESFREHALLEVSPHTGRTHQIRVHLAFIGCPVVGDQVYGRRTPSVPIASPEPGKTRFFLHAHSLKFKLPSTQQTTSFSAPLPPELEAVLSDLRRLVQPGAPRQNPS